MSLAALQVSKEAALCLKYNFLANAALDRNEVTLAIEYYDKAIATGYVDQQGVLLVSARTARLSATRYRAQVCPQYRS